MLRGGVRSQPKGQATPGQCRNLGASVARGEAQDRHSCVQAYSCTQVILLAYRHRSISSYFIFSNNRQYFEKHSCLGTCRTRPGRKEPGAVNPPWVCGIL